MDQSPTPLPPVASSGISGRVLMLGELFRLTWQHFAKNWKDVVILTVAISLPSNILAALLSHRTTAPITSPSAVAGIFTADVGISILILFLLGILIPMGLSVIIRGSLEGRTVSFQDALKQAFGRWGAGVKTSVIMGLLIFGLFLLLIVPGLYFSVLWSFTIFIVMEENISGFAAMTASKVIVKGRWWKVAGNVSILSIVAGLITGIIGAPFGNTVIGTIFAGTISSIGTSFALIGGYLLYRNLKANPMAASQTMPKS